MIGPAKRGREDRKLYGQDRKKYKNQEVEIEILEGDIDVDELEVQMSARIATAYPMSWHEAEKTNEAK